MSTKSIWIKPIALAGLAALAFHAAADSAFGNIVGSDVLNGDGTVTYTFTVDNSAGAFDVAAWSLEFGFLKPDWNQLEVASGGNVVVPNRNWIGDVGIPILAQSAQDFLALSPSGDVAIGQNLSGFSFTSRFLPGTITYYEFSADGNSVSGTTIGPVGTVPEAGGGVEAIAFGALAAFATATRMRRGQRRPLHIA